MPRRTSARRFSLAGGLLLASLLGCTQLVVYDKYPAGAAGASGNDGGGGGFGGSGTGGAFACDGTLRTLNFMVSQVDVIVALDRSTGMARTFDDGVTLADGTADALNTLVGQYQKSVRFGLAMFPTPAPSGCGSDPSCCVGPAGFPTSQGLAAFEATLTYCNMPGACPVTSQRPIGAALDSCFRTYISQFDQANARYVALITSGDPGCSSDACNEAQGKASGLTGISVSTEVFVVGATDISPCLSGLAVTGSSNPPHRAASRSDLADALDEFTKRVGRDACRIDLGRPISNSDQLVVIQNQTPLSSGPNGSWDLDPDRATIRLKGGACDHFLTAGATDLSIKACGHQ